MYNGGVGEKRGHVIGQTWRCPPEGAGGAGGGGAEWWRGWGGGAGLK